MSSILPGWHRSGRADEAVRRNVARLLGIESAEQLAESLVERASLSGGRVEAHEFGRDQHSSASAGAMLFGLASVPALSDEALAAFFDRVAGLVRVTGTVSGHDRDHISSTSSWSLAQVLLGLLVAARRLGRVRIPRLHKMVTALIRLQDQENGGWPLRPGESARPAFSFYPALALAHAWQSGVDRTEQFARSLAGAAEYLAGCLRQSVVSVEELLLALRTLMVMHRALVGTRLVTADLDLSATMDSLRERAWSSTHGVLLRNQSIVSYRQPTWHMTLWRPLFWMAVRGHASPLSPLDALLGDVVQQRREFDHEHVGAFLDRDAPGQRADPLGVPPVVPGGFRSEQAANVVRGRRQDVPVGGHIMTHRETVTDRQPHAANLRRRVAIRMWTAAQVRSFRTTSWANSRGRN